jgi:carboxyl-terminal processing protease
MRDAAYASSADAKTPKETYPGIRAALNVVADHHSQFVEPGNTKDFNAGVSLNLGMTIAEGYIARIQEHGPAERAGLKAGMKILSINGIPMSDESQRLVAMSMSSGKDSTIIASDGRKRPDAYIIHPVKGSRDFPPSGEMLRGRFGYVEVTAFGGTEAAAKRYTDQLSSIVRSLDNSRGLKGWIVDLRLNGGGNMYPMIAGLGALFGDGDLGSFHGPAQSVTWGYYAGEAKAGNEAFAKVPKPYTLKHAGAPIVVLIDKYTASSGEAVAVSFKGMPNVVFIGEPTRGLTSGNEVHTLSDGAILLLCEGFDADRTGKVYSGPIAPDVRAATNWWQYRTNNDGGLKAGLDWLAGLAHG